MSEQIDWNAEINKEESYIFESGKFKDVLAEVAGTVSNCPNEGMETEKVLQRINGNPKSKKIEWLRKPFSFAGVDKIIERSAE